MISKDTSEWINYQGGELSRPLPPIQKNYGSSMISRQRRVIFFSLCCMSWRGLGVPLTRFHQGSRFFPSLVSAGKRSNTLLSPWVQVCRLNSDLVTQNESHLTRHNDPPRSQAPSVIDQTQELDDKMIDKFKFKSFPKERLKGY